MPCNFYFVDNVRNYMIVYTMNRFRLSFECLFFHKSGFWCNWGEPQANHQISPRVPHSSSDDPLWTAADVIYSMCFNRHQYRCSYLTCTAAYLSSNWTTQTRSLERMTLVFFKLVRLMQCHRKMSPSNPTRRTNDKTTSVHRKCCDFFAFCILGRSRIEIVDGLESV